VSVPTEITRRTNQRQRDFYTPSRNFEKKLDMMVDPSTQGSMSEETRAAIQHQNTMYHARKEKKK
jgi:hypothetical protein